MKIFYNLLFILIPFLCFAQPIATDTFYSVPIVDKYRWLENTETSATNQWVEEQTERTRKALKTIQTKTKAYNRLNKFSNVQYSLPYRDGKNYYTLLYDQLDTAPSIYVKQSIFDKRPFRVVNPRDISIKDRIVISDFKESEDAQLIAFSFSRNGSDWKEIMVKKINGRYKKDHLVDVKFSPIAWKGEGFFYLKYPKNGKYAKEQNPSLMYHLLGTTQEQDEIIFRTSSRSIQEISFSVTPNKEYLIIRVHNDQRNTRNFYLKDLSNADSKLQPILTNFKSDLDILSSEGTTLTALTNHTDKNNAVVQFDITSPKEWTPLIPAFEDAILVDAQYINQLIICEYLVDTRPVIVFYSNKGAFLHKIEFDAGMQAHIHEADPSSNEVLMSYESYFLPTIVNKIDLDDFSEKLVDQTGATFNIEDFEMKTLKYKNRDNVLIPITIVHKKELKLDGSHPTLVKTYGGFGTIHRPSFDPGLIYFMKEGGVYAYCQVRGEGGLGIDWEESGKRLNKLNSVNDLIDGAEFLIQEQYTNSNKLAVTGGSNGGMVAGAAIMKRPELFKVAVLDVGVYDMLRAESFTVGTFHTDEFGTIKNKQDFDNLLSYSPLHNITVGTNYPTSLIRTGINDDRVPPFHSYKLVATLQDNSNQTNPIYLKVTEKAGHYGAKDIEGRLQDIADLYGFVLYHLQN